MNAILTEKMPDLPDCDNSTYRQWKAKKMAVWEAFTPSLVPIGSITDLSPDETDAIVTQCRQTNLCFYQTDANTPCEPESIALLGQQLGLGTPIANPESDDNNISAIEKQKDSRYIPYSDAPLKWHTDGYYNQPENAVASFILHCVRPAVAGGVNTFWDPEMIYILLRDENPEYIKALCHPQAMTIPENTAEGRPACANPVFAQSKGGRLLMRYSDRKRNIIWHKNCTDALQYLRELLENNHTFCVTHTLKAGQGVICDNVLHNRSAFENDEQNPRLLYRGRFRKSVKLPS